MVSSDLQHALSFQLSLQNGALLRTGYEVVFNIGKIIHAAFYLFGPNLTRRDYALGVILYSLILLVNASIACLAILWRNSKWLYRVLPLLALTEFIFIANCFTHDYLSCTRSDYSTAPPCTISVMASLVHAGLGVFGLWVIWSYAYATCLEQKMNDPVRDGFYASAAFRERASPSTCY